MDDHNDSAVDAAVIDCWRQNYCLDETPHDLYARWETGAPAGAVLALRAAVREIERQRAVLLRLAAALREAEALAMDAEAKAMRYIWLRDNASAEWWPMALRGGCTSREADALVDAAMASRPNVEVTGKPPCGAAGAR